MAIAVNLHYSGKEGAARKYAEEMTAGGMVNAPEPRRVICAMSIISRLTIRRP